MASKRPADLIPNPLIKRRNLEWTLAPPQPQPQPSAAAVESGKAQIDNHLDHFSSHLGRRIVASPRPLLPLDSFRAHYARASSCRSGAHFVIHQHDHPIAGTHYDLRLQINPVSSASWAIMYGPPGDPNSRRLNRNATETRVHSLWNHVVETASRETGSLLIWDTGTYTVLPALGPAVDPASQESSSSSSSDGKGKEQQQQQQQQQRHQQELLEAAFRSRKMRIQLHGSKLPEPYILNLRLTRAQDAHGRAKTPSKKRKHRRSRPEPQDAVGTTSASDDDDDDDDDEEKLQKHALASPTERELRELEDQEVRRTNAYPGAINSIDSIHQRKWYLSLDRKACGFVPTRQGAKTTWGRPDASSTRAGGGDDDDDAAAPDGSQRLSFPFYVRGVEHERSVVTSRTGADILRDEGVHGFKPRRGWKPILS